MKLLKNNDQIVNCEGVVMRTHQKLSAMRYSILITALTLLTACATGLYKDKNLAHAELKRLLTDCTVITETDPRHKLIGKLYNEANTQRPLSQYQNTAIPTDEEAEQIYKSFQVESVCHKNMLKWSDEHAPKARKVVQNLIDNESGIYSSLVFKKISYGQALMLSNQAATTFRKQLNELEDAVELMREYENKSTGNLVLRELLR